MDQNGRVRKQRRRYEPNSGELERLISTIASLLDALCEAIYERDLAVCRLNANPACYRQAMERYQACLRSKPLPPLELLRPAMICSRQFRLRDGDQLLNIELRFHHPAQGEQDWSCAFEIDWPDGAVQKQAYGFDSVQAILLAFQMAGVLLYTSRYHAEGRLCWNEPGGGYGLPLPSGMNDLLVGDDRQVP